MKFLGYILRNTRRNKLRSLLTVGSIFICAALAMVLLSMFSVNGDVQADIVQYNRAIVMNAQGFAQPVPIALRNEIARIDTQEKINGIVYRDDNGDGKGDTPLVTAFSWYGGKYGDEQIPTFAQFAVDPELFFDVYSELRIAPEQLKAFKEKRDGTVIGRKLAADKNLKVGDPFPMKGVIYPVDLNLTVVGIYDGGAKSDLRTCYFNWEFLNEQLKTNAQGRDSVDYTGLFVIKCKSGGAIPPLCKAVDEATRNSDRPTRSQTEEAFVGMFAEMIKDLQTYINIVGLAVAFALLIICGVAMAMTMRERTTEVAVLRAIGFHKGQILFIVLAEAVLIATVGGALGTVGVKLFCDVVDISALFQSPFFYVPWTVALSGLIISAVVGLASGLIPAVRAASIPVIDGLRKVV